MNIENHDLYLDETYYSMSDLAPEIKDGVLHTYSGKGPHRSWGSASCTTTVVIHTENFIAIHVGFAHKHRGNQGWHYFRVLDDGLWHKKTWRGITVEHRRMVLEQYNIEHIPSWELAKLPEAEQEAIKSRRVGLPSWAKAPTPLTSA